MYALLNAWLPPDSLWSQHWDPHVFGTSGSGSRSTSQRYGSKSGSFYHQAKIVRKTLVSTFLWLLYHFFSLKNDLNVPSKSNMRKKLFSISFLLASWQSVMKIAGSRSESGSGSISLRHGSADLDSHQNVMDPQHCFAMSPLYYFFLSGWLPERCHSSCFNWGKSTKEKDRSMGNDIPRCFCKREIPLRVRSVD